MTILFFHLPARLEPALETDNSIKEVSSSTDKEYMENIHFKCHFCTECSGYGCISELPGMGGIRENINFQLNCAAWDGIALESFTQREKEKAILPSVRLAPITGGVENVGYFSEEQFYYDLVSAVHKAGYSLSLGDGCPDIKLQTGIKAVQREQETTPDLRSAVFIKPYANEKIYERIDWSRPVANIIGVDIDSYNIVTMRNLVKLEKKTPAQLKEVQKYAGHPFAVKGVFTKEDVEMVKELKPDIIIISNHGGRVENRTGSTAEFLAEYGRDLKNNCDKLWVDGGIRKYRDLKIAGLLGADEVMIGRPFITALCKGASVTEQERMFAENYTLR